MTFLLPLLCRPGLSIGVDNWGIVDWCGPLSPKPIWLWLFVNTVEFYDLIYIFMPLELILNMYMCTEHASWSCFFPHSVALGFQLNFPAYIWSHPLPLGIFSWESFITLRQQTTVVICTIFHISNQRRHTASNDSHGLCTTQSLQNEHTKIITLA